MSHEALVTWLSFSLWPRLRQTRPTWPPGHGTGIICPFSLFGVPNVDPHRKQRVHRQQLHQAQASICTCYRTKTYVSMKNALKIV